jgi:hypothetical protein
VSKYICVNGQTPHPNSHVPNAAAIITRIIGWELNAETPVCDREENEGRKEAMQQAQRQQ